MKQEEAVREGMAAVVDCLEGCSGHSSSNDQSSSCLVHQGTARLHNEPS